MEVVRDRWLARTRTTAAADYHRWLIPLCALAIHLCIGMADGFSVFWLPLSHAVGVTDAVVCENLTLVRATITTSAFEVAHSEAQRIKLGADQAHVKAAHRQSKIGPSFM